jgi:broad specificity phosphatase PhoE
MQSRNPKRLFLARHGESVANQQKLICGQLDMPLTEKGRNQAQWLCDVLKTEKLSVIYASSLSRAVETARPTAEYHGIQVQVKDPLKEIHFGLLQGQEIGVDGIDSDQSGFKLDNTDKALGGEAYKDFIARVEHCLEAILADQVGDILVVGHRKTNEVILGKLLPLCGNSDKTANVKNKYLYEITLGDKPAINTIRLGGEFHGKKFAGLKDD